MLTSRSKPVPTPETKHFWDGTRERRLLLQQQRWKPSATLAVADLLPRLNSILRSLLRLPPVDEPPSPFEKELAVVIGWIEKRHGIGEKDLEEMSTNQGEKS